MQTKIAIINRQPQGQQSHTVYGQENLYRIAIQYYGEGTLPT